MSGFGIVMVGYTGAFGAGLIAAKKGQTLLGRFPSTLIGSAVKEGQTSCKEEALKIIRNRLEEYEITGVEEASEGGVFKGLWNLGEAIGEGFAVELKEIPIKQETVEICNYFDLNPYQLYCDGVLLIAAKDAWGLTDELKKYGIPAAIIGRTHPEKKRVILNEEEERFLEPRKEDSLTELGEDAAAWII